MSLILSRCPECKERIPVDDTRSKVYCMYCGAAIDFTDLRTDGAKSLEGVFDPGAITISAPNGRGCPIPVFVDGKEVTSVGRGEVVLFDVSPGRHEIWARVGIEGFTKTVFDVAPGDRFEIEQRGFKGYSVKKL